MAQDNLARGQGCKGHTCAPSHAQPAVRVPGTAGPDGLALFINTSAAWAFSKLAHATTAQHVPRRALSQGQGQSAIPSDLGSLDTSLTKKLMQRGHAVTWKICHGPGERRWWCGVVWCGWGRADSGTCGTCASASSSSSSSVSYTHLTLPTICSV
eukprot:3191378-Rhodomonas_salina.1